MLAIFIVAEEVDDEDDEDEAADAVPVFAGVESATPLTPPVTAPPLACCNQPCISEGTYPRKTVIHTFTSLLPICFAAAWKASKVFVVFGAKI